MQCRLEVAAETGVCVYQTGLKYTKCFIWCCAQEIVMLNGFGTVVNALGKRVKAYLPQICGTILWRLNNKSAKVRQQAADLISRIAIVMKTCQEVRAVPEASEQLFFVSACCHLDILMVYLSFRVLVLCLQCFDTVGSASERASGL